MKKYTEHELRKKAKSAADRFLNEGTDLNDTIASMVEPGKLSDHHIARICEMANHETRGRLFKDKNVDQSRVVFPAAKSVEVIKITRKPEVTMNIEKEASAHSSFLIPDEYFQSPRQVIASATYKEDSFMEKTASARSNVMRHQLEAIENEYHKLAREARSALREFGAARTDFFKQAAHDLRFGIVTPEQIVAIAAHVDDGDNEAYSLLDGNIDLMKEAMPVDKLKTAVDSMRDYINPDLKVKYVLGDTPLMIRFKGMVTASDRVRDKADSIRDLSENYNNIEKMIVQSDMNATSERNMPKVAGDRDFRLPHSQNEKKAAGETMLNVNGVANDSIGDVAGTAADAAKAKKGFFQPFSQNMRIGLLDTAFGVLEGVDAYKTDKSHFSRMNKLRKDPNVAGGYMKELVEKNPEQWSNFQKKWGDNRWISDTMSNKARARQRDKETKPGDIDRMPQAKAFHDLKNKIVNQDLKSYNDVMKPNTVSV